MLKKKVVAIIQARMDSNRLPGKIIEKIGDKTLIEILVNRVKKSKTVDTIVIATTDKSSDDVVEELSSEIGVKCFRGSEEDVLGRYAECSKLFNADVVVRITGDNPLTDVELIDKLVEAHLKNNADYTYSLDTPLGVGSEVIGADLLEEISVKAELDFEREHVTPYIRSHNEDYKILDVTSNLKNENLRLTVDTPEDLKFINALSKSLGDLEDIKTGEIIKFLDENPQIKAINSNIKQKPADISEVKNLIFITEGSQQIGMGHVFRSLTLAKMLVGHLGVDVHFLTKSDTSVIRKIENEGFKTFQIKEHLEVLDYLESLNPRVVIIDNLVFEEDILKQLQERVKIVLVDNVDTNLNKYADMVMSLYKSQFVNKNYFNRDTDTQYFCGPKYLILRDEFYNLTYENQLNPEINDILLIFGGSDPSNLTSKVLEKIGDNFCINIVLGPGFKYYDILDGIIDKYQYDDVTVHFDPNNIADLMASTDLIITSPGISLFEAMYTETPAIAISQDELQHHFYIPLNYEYLIKEDEIKHLTHYMDELSDLSKRREIIGTYNEIGIGQGKLEILDYLSKIFQ